jgi:uncharacterized membrane protein YhaH (DUF805 family)
MRYVLRFNSRGSRSEFWWVTAALIGGVALTAIADEMILPKTGDYARAYDIMTMVSVPLYICGLLLFLSVTVRRLHDIGLVFDHFSYALWDRLHPDGMAL